MPFDSLPQETKPELKMMDALIDRLGVPERWCKGALERRGANCIYGALYMVDRGEINPSLSRTGYAVLDAIKKAIGSGEVLAPVYFNNAPETTHADLMSMLRRARALLAAQ